MDLQNVVTATEHYTEQIQDKIQWQLGSVEAQFMKSRVIMDFSS
jgi:hypothetical protein